MPPTRAKDGTKAKTVTANVEQITPDTALEMLDLNKVNRNINRHHVLTLAGAMERGEWHLNGQSISFDSNGVLQDGQHRLMAVVKSQTTVPMLVVRNVDPEARPTVDVGRKRTVADELTMRGEKNAGTLGAIMMMIRRVEKTGGQGLNVVLTTVQAVEQVNDDPQLRLAAAKAEYLRGHVLAPASVLGYAHYKFAGVDAGAAEKFWEPFITGQFSGPKDPRFVLQRTLARLAADRNFSTGNFGNKIFMAALVVRAWNAWRKGHEVSYLRWTKGQEFPKVAQ